MAAENRRPPHQDGTDGDEGTPKAVPPSHTPSEQADTRGQKKTSRNPAAKRPATRRSPQKPASADPTVALGALRLPDPGSVPRTSLDAYPPGVPLGYEYPLVPLTRFLDDAAGDFPETAALGFMGTELSYGKLLDHVDRLAGALQELGLGRRDRIALLLPNCPQHIIALFAIWRIGATVVDVDPDEDVDELGRRLSETQVRALVFLDPVYEKLERVLGFLPTVEHLIGTGLQDYLPFAKKVLFPLFKRRDLRERAAGDGRLLRFTDLIKRSSPVFIEVAIDPVQDVAAVLYTSGKTGEPKGVMLTHLNLVANAFQARLWIPDIQSGRERVLCLVPFSSAWGLTGSLGVGMLSGVTFTLVPEFDRGAVLKIIDGQQPSLCVATPSMLAELVEGPDVSKFDLSSLRVCQSVGGPLSPDLIDLVEELTGGKLRETYGLVEAGPFTHANPIYGMSKSGSIGLPMPDTICLVVDQHEPSRPVPPGQPGELAIHGPQVMSGYVNRASDTAVALRDGWLLTGDIVVVDEDGYYHLVDQKHEVISRAGRDVHPRDVEAVLAGHPKVARVVVAGIPEFAGGEMLKAYVVLQPGEIATSGEIDDFCRAQLAPYQVPERYEFRAFLPSAPPGRPMREALIAEELAQLGRS